MSDAPLPAGWVRVPRWVLDPRGPLHPLARGERACRLAAFADLLAMAEWRPNAELRPGELRASVRFLARRWSWPPSTVDDFLRALEQAGCIERTPRQGRRAGHIRIYHHATYGIAPDTRRGGPDTSPDAYLVQNTTAYGIGPDTSPDEDEEVEEKTPPPSPPAISLRSPVPTGPKNGGNEPPSPRVPSSRPEATPRGAHLGEGAVPAPRVRGSPPAPAADDISHGTFCGLARLLLGPEEYRVGTVVWIARTEGVPLEAMLHCLAGAFVCGEVYGLGPERPPLGTTEEEWYEERWGEGEEEPEPETLDRWEAVGRDALPTRDQEGRLFHPRALYAGVRRLLAEHARRCPSCGGRMPPRRELCETCAAGLREEVA